MSSFVFNKYYYTQGTKLSNCFWHKLHKTRVNTKIWTSILPCLVIGYVRSALRYVASKPFSLSPQCHTSCSRLLLYITQGNSRNKQRKQLSYDGAYRRPQTSLLIWHWQRQHAGSKLAAVSAQAKHNDGLLQLRGGWRILPWMPWTLHRRVQQGQCKSAQKLICL